MIDTLLLHNVLNLKLLDRFPPKVDRHNLSEFSTEYKVLSN